jgi:hypothetical protein
VERLVKEAVDVEVEVLAEASALHVVTIFRHVRFE